MPYISLLRIYFVVNYVMVNLILMTPEIFSPGLINCL